MCVKINGISDKERTENGLSGKTVAGEKIPERERLREGVGESSWILGGMAMKRVLYVWVCLMLCGISLAAQEQVIYVSANGSDTWVGSQTQPYGTIYKALEVAAARSGTVEVRVAVGVYPVSITKAPKKGTLVIPVHVTLKGGYLNGEAFSVQNVLAPDRESPAGQTILQGDSTCRVALVKGGLEQVVVTGGRAEGANGGGVLVESGGSVNNCIIHSNQASGRAPKVGDLLMKNGDYVDVSSITYEQKDQVAGVVFWVNPKRDAPKGERGRAVSVKQFRNNMIAPIGYTGGLVSKKSCFITNVPDLPPYYEEIEEAINDMDGKANTDDWSGYVNSCVEFPLAKDCRSLGEQWYIPAAGEVMLILTEWSMVENTFHVLWDKIWAGASGNQEIIRDYFGLNSSAIGSWYNTGEHFLLTPGQLISSTRANKQNIWILTSSFINASKLNSLSIYELAGNFYTLGSFLSCAVCQF